MNIYHLFCLQKTFGLARGAFMVLLVATVVGCSLQRGVSEEHCLNEGGKVTMTLKENSVAVNLVDEKGLRSSHEFTIGELDRIIQKDQKDSLLPMMKLSRCPVCCSKKADFRECFKYCLDSSECCDNGEKGRNCTNLGNE